MLFKSLASASQFLLADSSFHLTLKCKTKPLLPERNDDSFTLTFQHDRPQDHSGHLELGVQISSLAGAASLATAGVVVVHRTDKDLALQVHRRVRAEELESPEAEACVTLIAARVGVVCAVSWTPGRGESRHSSIKCSVTTLVIERTIQRNV